MAAFNDHYYIERVRAGDINAFSYIMSHYQRMVLTIVIRIVNNKEDAEDITQEIFVKVFKSLDSFKGQSEFSTWLYRIAYNTTLSEIRRKQISFTSFEDNPALLKDEEIGEEIDDLDTEEKIRYLEEALNCLHPEEKLIISLFYLNDQGIEEISKITNLSKANVKVRLHRIRKKLNSEINQLMAK